MKVDDDNTVTQRSIETWVPSIAEGVQYRPLGTAVNNQHQRHLGPQLGVAELLLREGGGREVPRVHEVSTAAVDVVRCEARGSDICEIGEMRQQEGQYAQTNGE